ncbi:MULTISPECIES: prolyl oligopeptidase family serine peptidase [Flavobacteriaceae]|uniref:carboxylesterase family protein n=1 Tax=Flavobacteriaceae TaxID=49546 RepID=UPI0014929E1B|nr:MULTISPECIES: PHB depolymerase family esterase [Allomuricauda]MDC6366904.1 PHB depolymerase family esterase [Muricauda sp. AC10]
MGYPKSLFKLFFFGCVTLLQGCLAQSQLIEDELQTVTKENYKYYLYYPAAYESNPDEEFGLLLFLHGGGDAGKQLNHIQKSGPPKLLAEGYKFPFLVLAPSHPHQKKWWNTSAVVQLLDSIVATNRVDKNRIYLTGLSRGGSAAWEMATQYPNKFAAMAVVCGMAPLPYAHWINKKMPIWVFHGDQDDVIDVKESDQMVAKLKQMGYQVNYTRYSGVGHNSWERAYTTDSLYTWFAQQKL